MHSGARWLLDVKNGRISRKGVFRSHKDSQPTIMTGWHCFFQELGLWLYDTSRDSHYLDILTKKSSYLHIWDMQQDKGPKHTSISGSKSIKTEKVLERLSQRLKLYPIKVLRPKPE